MCIDRFDALHGRLTPAMEVMAPTLPHRYSDGVLNQSARVSGGGDGGSFSPKSAWAPRDARGGDAMLDMLRREADELRRLNSDLQENIQSSTSFASAAAPSTQQQWHSDSADQAASHLAESDGDHLGACMRLRGQEARLRGRRCALEEEVKAAASAAALRFPTAPASSSSSHPPPPPLLSASTTATGPSCLGALAFTVAQEIAEAKTERELAEKRLHSEERGRVEAASRADDAERRLALARSELDNLKRQQDVLRKQFASGGGLRGTSMASWPAEGAWQQHEVALREADARNLRMQLAEARVSRDESGRRLTTCDHNLERRKRDLAALRRDKDALADVHESMLKDAMAAENDLLQTLSDLRPTEATLRDMREERDIAEQRLQSEAQEIRGRFHRISTELDNCREDLRRCELASDALRTDVIERKGLLASSRCTFDEIGQRLRQNAQRRGHELASMRQQWRVVEAEKDDLSARFVLAQEQVARLRTRGIEQQGWIEAVESERRRFSDLQPKVESALAQLRRREEALSWQVGQERAWGSGLSNEIDSARHASARAVSTPLARTSSRGGRKSPTRIRAKRQSPRVMTHRRCESGSNGPLNERRRLHKGAVEGHCNTGSEFSQINDEGGDGELPAGLRNSRAYLLHELHELHAFRSETESLLQQWSSEVQATQRRNQEQQRYGQELERAILQLGQRARLTCASGTPLAEYSTEDDAAASVATAVRPCTADVSAVGSRPSEETAMATFAESKDGLWMADDGGVFYDDPLAESPAAAHALPLPQHPSEFFSDTWAVTSNGGVGSEGKPRRWRRRRALSAPSADGAHVEDGNCGLLRRVSSPNYCCPCRAPAGTISTGRSPSCKVSSRRPRAVGAKLLA
eukprot:TRINITY_DN44052_c0_g1_i1.p1 TRINITY_DN44052_c0_g1~~TRINITY_DN44052_c0_g1_i1.p1  ORF type:complete len:872 (-),score=150.59 TRINITY_DN44052_c0_g1_i1:237-2852(-)